MAFAFDTLGYSKKLREAGIPQRQAEAHAEAAREFIMAEVVTKPDLQLALDNLALRLTIRVGVIVGAGLTILLAIQTYLFTHPAP